MLGFDFTGNVQQKRKQLVAHMGDTVKAKRERNLREAIATELRRLGVATVVHFSDLAWHGNFTRLSVTTIVIAPHILTTMDPLSSILSALPEMERKYKVSQRSKTAS